MPELVSIAAEPPSISADLGRNQVARGVLQAAVEITALLQVEQT